RLKKKLLQYPRVETDLIDLSSTYSNFRFFNSELQKDNYEPYSEQEPGHDGEKEAGSTTLAPGQTLQGTGLSTLQTTELANNLHWLQ
ncbi:hypothetical protein MMC28_010809, partial [Mycoblastus sanguinarius]|nr:hypothetical protein [Mycoblastus sanguinarius]